MKHLLLILLLSPLSLLAQPSLPLNKAVENGVLRVRIAGRDWGATEDYQNATLVLEAQNVGGGTYELHIPAGQQFICKEDPFQDQVNTRELILVMEPGKRRMIPLHTMCTQMRDMSPGSAVYYEVGPMAQGPLLEIARYLSEQNMWKDSDGQQAVWAITDRNPIYHVGHKELQVKLSEATGMEIVERPDGAEVLRPRRIPTFTVKGKIEFALNEESTVTIAMFDSTGTQVKTFYDEVEKGRGRHWLKFKFSWKEGDYLMRVIVNGEIKGEDTYKLRES